MKRDAHVTHPDEIQVTGLLADDAVVLFSAGNAPPTATLTFRIQPQVGLCYFVHQVIDAAEVSAQIATKAKAYTMRRNTPVTVYAKGIRMQSDHGMAGLRLLDVTNVIVPNLPAAHGEANHPQEL